MEDLLRSHLKKSSTDIYIQENDTYGQHLQTTLNRRLYLGQIEESQMLFMPKRSNRTWKETAIDLVPSISSIWLFGISVTYTYPKCIRLFRFFFPNIRSFFLIHAVTLPQGIAPMMMTINLNLLGIFKGMSYIYFDYITGGKQSKLLEDLMIENE